MAKIKKTFFTKRESDMKDKDVVWNKQGIKEHMKKNMDDFMENNIKNDDWKVNQKKWHKAIQKISKYRQKT